MNRIDVIFILAIISMLLTAVVMFTTARNYVGKNSKSESIKAATKFIPIILVGFTLLIVIATSLYYERQMEKEQQLLLELEKKRFTLKIDSISNRDKRLLIDSLSIYKKTLSDLINRLEKQSKVTGKGFKSISEAKTELNKASLQIEEVKEYNEVVNIPDSVYDEYYGKHTGRFEFDCPTKSNQSYIDVILSFHEKKLVSEIGFLYVNVVQETDKANHVTLIWQETFSVQMGVNKLRMKNYFNKPKLKVEIGYFLKSDMKKKTPVFYRISCG